MRKFIPIALTLVALTMGGPLLAAPVNVNQASAEQLAESLQGVGLKKAQAIVQYREQNGEFQSKNDLLNVKGIGVETLEKNDADILLK
jgi:competence protein ComEA